MDPSSGGDDTDAESDGSGDSSGSGSRSGSGGDDDDGDGGAVSNVGNDNAVAVPVIPGVLGTALFRTIACVNHSCEPNAEVRFGHDHEVLLVALRHIKEGEELCISYVDCDTLSLARRRARLRRGYGFWCRCARCMRELAAGSETCSQGTQPACLSECTNE